MESLQVLDNESSSNVACLQNTDTGARTLLSATTIVGRSQRCQLRIQAASVSAVHAQINWDGRRWSVRDMNSTNGTTLDGRRLASGERAQLNVGSVIAFGSSDQRYTVQSISPPRLMATAADVDPVVATGDLLCLPNPEACELSIFRDAENSWVIESADGLLPLEDQQLVVAGSKHWCISLPDAITTTHEHSTRQELPITLHDYTLILHKGREGEQPRAELVHDQHKHDLEHRAHNQLLLALVQARLADHGQNQLPEAEQGWVYRDALLSELTLDLSHLNIWLFRARQQVAMFNIPAAGSLFERRAGTKQLRIGMSKLRIESPDSWARP